MSRQIVIFGLEFDWTSARFFTGAQTEFQSFQAKFPLGEIRDPSTVVACRRQTLRAEQEKKTQRSTDKYVLASARVRY